MEQKQINLQGKNKEDIELKLKKNFQKEIKEMFSFFIIFYDIFLIISISDLISSLLAPLINQTQL